MSGPARVRAGSRIVSRVACWVRSVVRPNRLRQEMEAEIGFHIASRAEDLEREGLPAVEALRQARVEFGAEAAHRAGMREALGLRPLDELVADLRYGLRLLRKSPGFAATAVCSLGLAIGANAAIFSTANELLFARLGVPRAAELRSVEEVRDVSHGGDWDTWNSAGTKEGGLLRLDTFSYPAFRAIARQMEQRGLMLLGYQDAPNITMSGAGEARAVSVELVSGSYYGVMEMQPTLGRALGLADDRVDQGAPLAAVVSYGLWQRVFGGARDVLGRTIRLNGSLATVVGVNPRGFTGGGSVQISPDVFVPLTAIGRLKPLIGRDDPLHSGSLGWVKVGLRARPGTAENAVAAGLTVMLEAEMLAEGGREARHPLPWVALEDGSRGTAWARNLYGKPVYALLGLVGLLLLLACTNVANLLLARARTRGREMSLRLALGARRARIFRQLLTEALLLSSLGGALGLALAFSVRDVVPRLLWTGHGAGEIQVPFDWRVFAFTAGISIGSALLAGLAPAWRALQQEPGEALKNAGAVATGRRRFWGAQVLVVLEVGLALVLVASAGLFLRTMVNLEEVDPGFKTKGLLLFEVNLPPLKYPPAVNRRMHAQLLQTVRSTPGVESASLATVPALAKYESTVSFYLERPLGDQKEKARDVNVEVNTVAPGFFETMGIPIVAGHAFTEGDLARTNGLAVINQSMAKHYFPGVNPIGRRFSSSDSGGERAWTEIVGICRDTQYYDPHEQPKPMYFDLLRESDDLVGATYMVRTKGRPEDLVPALRRVVARLDPDLPLTDVRTQEEQIREVTQQERLMATLSLGFGVLALLLAAVGVYGVLSYSVAERTREIGIRLALGADRGQVQGLVLREAGWLAGVGVVAGLGATLALGSFVRALLFGVRPADPVALAGAAAVLLLLALLAAWVPARRAARVEPMVALRHE